MKARTLLLAAVVFPVAACVLSRDVEEAPRLTAGEYDFHWIVETDTCWPDGLPGSIPIPMELVLATNERAEVLIPGLFVGLLPPMYGTRDEESFAVAGVSVLNVTSDCSLVLLDVMDGFAIPPPEEGRGAFAGRLRLRIDGQVTNQRGEPSDCSDRVGEPFFPEIYSEPRFPTLSNPVDGACEIQVHGETR